MVDILIEYYEEQILSQDKPLLGVISWHYLEEAIAPNLLTTIHDSLCQVCVISVNVLSQVLSVALFSIFIQPKYGVGLYSVLGHIRCHVGNAADSVSNLCMVLMVFALVVVNVMVVVMVLVPCGVVGVTVGLDVGDCISFV